MIIVIRVENLSTNVCFILTIQMNEQQRLKHILNTYFLNFTKYTVLNTLLFI